MLGRLATKTGDSVFPGFGGRAPTFVKATARQAVAAECLGGADSAAASAADATIKDRETTPPYSGSRRNRRAFDTTQIELRLIAAAASIGLSDQPNAG